MADFTYRAARLDGQFVEGRIKAAGRDQVLSQLRLQNLTPLEVSEVAVLQVGNAPRESLVGFSAASGQGGSQSLRFADVHSITSELSTMLRAGLPIDRALKVLIGMDSRPAVVAVLEDLLGSVKSGKGLSQALVAHQQHFGDFYISMIRSGEASGQLSEVLYQLSEHLERLRVLRESAVSALIYPAVLVVVATLSVIIMIGFVVPQFESMFNDLGDALPMPTRIVIAAGDFVSEHGWGVAVVLTLVVIFVRKWFASSSGKAWRDKCILMFPVIGDVLRKYEITCFARSLGTLLKNGVPMVSAIRIASQTMSNQHLRGALVDVIPEIKRGRRMAEALGGASIFSLLILNMIKLGEETGRLDEMLLEIARVHDDQVQTGIKRALQLVEPALILTLGGVIAFIIVSILMGILSVNDLVM
jgi:general secretion pathway protein F